MRKLFVAILVMACSTSALAAGKLQGYVELGGQSVRTSGFLSTTKAQISYPGATVTVYVGGTTTLATIYSDSSLTPQANPFTADSNAFWSFYAGDGDYDVRFSGTGIVTPWTISGMRIGWQGTTCVGDGVTDVTACLQTLINATPAGGTLVLAGGVNYQYKVTSTINVTSPITITGGGGKATILSETPYNTEKLFFITSSGVTFEDLIFDGSAAASTTLTVRHVALYFDGNGGTISGLRVKDCIFRSLSRKGIGNPANIYVSTTTGNGVSPIVITTAQSHSLTTGDKVSITSVAGNTAANVTNNAVTVVDPTHFSLDGTTGNGTYGGNGIVGGVTNTSGAGVSPITVTTVSPHGLTTGNYVTVSGVLGNTAANVAYAPVTVIDPTHFSIPGTGNGAYAGGGTLGDYGPSQGMHGDQVTPGNGSLACEYAMIFTEAEDIWVERNVMTEISGAGVYLTNSRNAHVTGNNIGMLTASDSLYPIHVDRSNSNDCYNIWIMDNIVHDGRRTSGGAVDIMAQDVDADASPIRNVWIINNLVDNCPGFGSGTAAIRVLSTENGQVRGNTVRRLGDPLVTYILVDARVSANALPDNIGPLGIEVTDNLLVAGSTDQTGIAVRHSKFTAQIANTGQYTLVSRNQLRTDYTNYFARGINVVDNLNTTISENLISYKKQTNNWYAVEITGTLKTLTGVKVINNTIDGNASANSRGVQVSGTVDGLIIALNTIFNTGSFAIRTENTVTNVTIQENTCSGISTTAISNTATGQSFSTGNRYNATAAITGTWTITVGNPSVTINTAEVQSGDRINLNVTTTAGTDKAVKAGSIVAGTSFVVGTVDGTNVAGANLVGTWRIDH